jgi:hypothetical protein
MKIHITKAIAPGRNGLSHGIPRFRFFSLKNSVPHFLPSFTQANQFCSKQGHPRCVRIFRPSQADLSNLPSIPQKKEKCTKSWHVLAEPICW